VILYLTYWVPSAERAKVAGLFMAAIPLSSVVGAPISGWILGAMNDVAGLAGWQWLFILEAAPSVILGFIVLGYLDDRPAEAAWLEAEERAGLTRVIEAEERHRVAHRGFTLREALTNPRVLGFGGVYLGIVTGLYGIGFWMPQIIKGFGLTNLQTGFVTAIPFLVGLIAMLVASRHSDKTMERVWHVAGPALLGGFGFVWAAYTTDPVLGMVALTVASAGIFAALPTFWTLPTAILSGTAAAGGIALINAIGNLGGFVGPYAVGWVKDQTGSYAMGMMVLAACLFGAGLLTLALGHRREAEALAPAE
jgi:MFS family permease